MDIIRHTEFFYSNAFSEATSEVGSFIFAVRIVPAVIKVQLTVFIGLTCTSTAVIGSWFLVTVTAIGTMLDRTWNNLLRWCYFISRALMINALIVTAVCIVKVRRTILFWRTPKDFVINSTFARAIRWTSSMATILFLLIWVALAIIFAISLWILWITTSVYNY